MPSLSAAIRVPPLLLLLAAPSMSWAQAQNNGPAPPRTREQQLDDAIPITPEMIRDLLRRQKENDRTKEAESTPVASPIPSRAISVNFQTGTATSIIQTVKGFPTALSFFDSTGQPWPIAWDTSSNAAGGSSGNCNTSAASTSGPVEVTGFHSCVPVKGSNVLQITPMSLAPRGGMLVSLQGAPKPIAFLIIGGEQRYDADITVRVADRGPNARMQIDTRPGAPVTGAPFMNAMLSGIAPADAKPLSIEGVSPDEIRGWRLGNEVFLRTRHTLMSPPWSASERGAGNVTVYALPNTPVALLSIDGRTTSVALKE